MMRQTMLSHRAELCRARVQAGLTCLPFGGARRYARRSRDGETRFYHSYSRLDMRAQGFVEGRRRESSSGRGPPAAPAMANRRALDDFGYIPPAKAQGCAGPSDGRVVPVTNRPVDGAYRPPRVGGPRPGRGPPANIDPGAGDWECPGCGNWNWARRHECNKCGVPHPTRKAPPPSKHDDRLNQAAGLDPRKGCVRHRRTRVHARTHLARRHPVARAQVWDSARGREAARRGRRLQGVRRRRERAEKGARARGGARDGGAQGGEEEVRLL